MTWSLVPAYAYLAVLTVILTVHDIRTRTLQKVPVKILLPVIVCFLPGIFIIVLGPAAISFVQLMGNF